MAYIEFNHLVKKYASNGVSISALEDASFSVQKGELAVILGASGAGKTTALNILGGMDTITSGDVIVDGEYISNYDHRQLVSYRRTDIGFVFQFYNLVPNLTALENVELAAQICQNSLGASETLNKVGLAERKSNFPAQLSGGEQQRVSIARAIAKNPKLLLCDEPTGALDYNTGKQIYSFCRIPAAGIISVLIITHNSAIAPMADRVIHFKSGKVVKLYRINNPPPLRRLSGDIMSQAFHKDILRSIKGLKRFLSILIITALGVGMMTGLCYAPLWICITQRISF